MSKLKTSEIEARILIVDDEKSNRFILEKTIAKLECEVDSCDNGDKAARLCDNYQYALILLDVNMPGLNGHDTLKLIKQTKKNKTTPVFMVTAVDTNAEVLSKSYQLGAVDYITKPVNIEVLRRKAMYFIEMFNNKFLLEKEKEVSERLLKSKMNLMASITHELRSPLFAMIGMTDVLESMGLNSQQEQILHKVQSNSEYLLSVVNSFLDFSKFEEGKTEVQNTDFELIPHLTELIDILSYQNQNRDDVILKVEVDETIPKIIKMDKVKLRHILINLVSNSLKFTVRGEVKIVVTNFEEKLKFEVIDTGVGISEENQKMLFGRYVQIENNQQRVHSGTGLGLAISSSMVDAMGGEISLTSKEGVGSNFFFIVPFIKSDIKSILDKKPRALTSKQSYLKLRLKKKLKVLIVDDVVDNIFIIKSYINHLNLEIIDTTNPYEGLEYLKKGHFDLCFMDINMPNLSGIEVCEKYHRYCDEKGVEKTPILALTAHLIDDELDTHYKSKGFNSSLSKPIRRKELVTAILDAGDVIEAESLESLKRNDDIKNIVKEDDSDDMLCIFDDLDKNLKSYLPKYLSNKVTEMEDLVKANSLKDLEQVKSIVHKVLGTALSFGIVKVNNELLKVQEYVHSDRYESDYEEITQLIDSSANYIKSLSSKMLKAS